MHAIIRFLIIALIISGNWATSATLTWSSNTETNLAGYRIYSSTNGGISFIKYDVGNTNLFVVPDILPGITYTFYATAYNVNGLESAPSVSVTYKMSGSVTNFPPIFTTHPISKSIVEGQSLVLSCVLTGTPPISLNWFKNTNPIPGATNTILTISNTTTNDAGNYFVFATNALGTALSTIATVVITSNTTPIIRPPSVTQQPTNQIVNVGEIYTLSIRVSGSSPMYFQWFRNGKSIDGATSLYYTGRNTTFKSNGEYYCRVSNASGTTFSEKAYITVLEIPPQSVQDPKVLSTSPEF